MKEGRSSSLHSQRQNDDHSHPFKFSKLFDPEASWDKDQLGDVLHWIRQIIALICGMLWGAIPLIGGTWIIFFLVLSSGIIYAYYALVLKIDAEDFGSHGTLLQEGLFASISVFVLAWTLVYSLMHF